ncbi:MAG TPA: helix-turn-helix domain-containing protein [Solirubrobacteraceae bacterium]
MDRESLRLLLAQGTSIEKIAARFGRHPSTVAYWMKKHGLQAPHRERHAARGGIDRDELTAAVVSGLSIAGLAASFDCSKATVRHWLGRYGLRTKAAEKASTSREARAAGLLSVKMNCAEHGDCDFILEGRGYYRCKQCRQERVTRRRRKVKALLVAEAGGACCLCGYKRHVGALEFHHVNPSEKRLAIAARGVGLSLPTARAEARKCVLVCSNCHAELEGGVSVLPGKVDADPVDLPGAVRGSPDAG